MIENNETQKASDLSSFSTKSLGEILLSEFRYSQKNPDYNPGLCNLLTNYGQKRYNEKEVSGEVLNCISASYQHQMQREGVESQPPRDELYESVNTFLKYGVLAVAATLVGNVSPEPISKAACFIIAGIAVVRACLEFYKTGGPATKEIDYSDYRAIYNGNMAHMFANTKENRYMLESALGHIRAELAK